MGSDPKEKGLNELNYPKNPERALVPVYEPMVEGEEHSEVDKGNNKHKRKKRWHTEQLNIISARKGVAEGMMDIALLTANANQLRFHLELSPRNANFYIAILLISISILLQIGVGVILLIKPSDRRQSKGPQSQMLKKLVVAGVFLITIMNVMIAAFSNPEARAVANKPQ